MKPSTRPQVIVFASSKGGVGKSTTCACLAAAIAGRRKTAHILDFDPNQSLARWLVEFPRKRVSCTAVAKDEVEAALQAWTAPGACDVLLIDVAGLYEESLILAIGAADLVVIPMQASKLDMIEAALIVEDVRAFEARFGTIVPHAILLTAVHPLATKVFDFVLAEIERLGLPRFETVILQRTVYRELFLNGEAPHRADQHGKAGREISALLNEIDVRCAAARKTDQEAA